MRPNILVIMTDQHNVNTLGCYGNPVIRTPNIDRLAAEGVLFERTYVTIPLCVPSRASIWSSLYPHSNGVLVNDDDREIALASSVVTIGDVAKAAGYACGYIGKWHIGREQVPQHGFTDAWWTHLRGSYEQDLEESEHVAFAQRSDLSRLAARLQQRGEVGFEQAHDTVVTTRTIDFIRAHAGEPFLAVCSLRAPHDPYIGPFNDLYDPAAVVVPGTLRETFSGKPRLQIAGVPRQWFESMACDDGCVDERRMRQVIARYWGMVHMIDLNVGRLLDCLADLAIDERTVVVFMADHGEMMGNHGLMSKGNFLYEGATRVPFILRHKGRVPAGRRASGLASTIDVVPTLLELAGLAQPEAMQGISLRQYWDYAFNVRDAVFMQTWESYGMFDPILGVRTDRWKYSWHLADRDELYDMTDDPDETRNLAADTAYREVMRGLRGRITEWLEQTGDIKLSSLSKIHKGFASDF